MCRQLRGRCLRRRMLGIGMTPKSVLTAMRFSFRIGTKRRTLFFAKVVANRLVGYEGHYSWSGFVGMKLARTLVAEGRDVVLIDKDAERVDGTRRVYGIDRAIHPNVVVADAILAAVHGGIVGEAFDLGAEYGIVCLTVESGSPSSSTWRCCTAARSSASRRSAREARSFWRFHAHCRNRR